MDSLEPRQLLCLDHDTGLMSSLPRAESSANEPVVPVASARGGGDSLAVPVLSSRPSASRKLYIDFDGQTQLRWGSWAGLGGTLTGNTPAFDTDGDMLNFSDVERSQIRQIWAIVVEKYSIFDLDVTTIEPPSLSDGVACKVVVGGNGDWYGSGGGVAYRGGFNGGTLDNDNVGWVWDGQGGGGDVNYIGEGVAHEAGHMFGLSHQSQYSSGRLVAEYRYGPIMGGGSNGDGDPGARWYVGDSSGRDWYDGSIDFRGIQNDITGMVAGGLPLLADDVGNTTAGATTLALSPTGAATAKVITSESDVDMFRIQPSIGTLTKIRVVTPELGAMLNSVLTLYSSSGAVLATADSGSTYDEALSIPAASGSSYYIGVSSKVLGSTVGISVGRYSLYIDTTGPDDDSAASARKFDQFGVVPMVSPNGKAWGRSIFNGAIGSTDTNDWYAFALYGTTDYTITLTGLSANADLQLRFPSGHSGVPDESPDDLLNSSMNGSGASESMTGRLYPANQYIYVRVLSPSGTPTNYTLTVTLDSAIEGAITPPVSRLSLPNFEKGDFVASGDLDTWRVGSDIGYSYPVAFNVDVRPLTASLTLELGYDLDNDGILDAGEILSTPSATTSTPAQLRGIQAYDPSGHRALMRIRAATATSTNYVITSTLDTTPTYSLNINDLRLAPVIRGFNGSVHGMSVIDYLDDQDFIDAVSIGVPAPGAFQMQAIMLGSGAAHQFQLIRDLDSDGMVDSGEIVATGLNLNYNVPTNNTAPFFARVIRDGQNTSAAAYQLKLRDGAITNTFGGDIGKPRQLGSPASGTQTGFVGSSIDTYLHRPADYFAFTIANKTRFNASLSVPLLQEGGLPDGIGLQIVKDVNNNGLIDAGDSIINNAPGSIGVTLDAGNYFVGVLAAPAEGVAEALYDYTLNYSTSAVTDAIAPALLAAEYLFETREAHGLKLVFSEDVQTSIDAGDVAIKHLASGATFTPTGSVYDASTSTLGLSLQTQLPDGDYEVRIGAGLMFDVSGNALPTSVKSFFVLAGDVNRDRSVNFSDLLIVAQNYGTSGKTFSQGNFDYDVPAAVDFSDLLMLAQRYGTTLMSALPSESAAKSRSRNRDLLV